MDIDICFQMFSLLYKVILSTEDGMFFNRILLDLPFGLPFASYIAARSCEVRPVKGPAAGSIIHYSSYLLYCAQLQTVWSEEEECALYSAQCAAIVTSKKNEVSDP